ncbi:hypothetical protein LBMAG53_17980 [Planctomycetota bacterium]|nr:hypothetical protein LBMAG53_17980 [Planctomycetota bacterium]
MALKSFRLAPIITSEEGPRTQPEPGRKAAMEITFDNRPLDQARRKNADQTGRAQATDRSGATAGQDAVDLSGFDQASIGQLVQRLRDMPPTDVQRIEDLRQRIASGAYTATPDELAESLLGPAAG